jgi:hypothetical protein
VALVLRQICLVVRDLERSTRTLNELFGIKSAYTDPAVLKYGLTNAVFPIGTNFLELVSPTKEGTAGGRHLERRGGDAGYMVILHCEDVAAREAHVVSKGVRIVNRPTYEHYRGIHLHPADTGGALLEFNRDVGGDDPMGSYHPAGAEWQKFIRTSVVQSLIGAELQSPDPAKLAARWGELLQVAPTRDGVTWILALDSGYLRVVPDGDGRGEFLSGIDLRCANPAPVLDQAVAMGLPSIDGHIVVFGLQIRLVG